MLPVYNEHRFRQKVEAAIAKVRTILDTTRNPQLPSEVHHEYEDKYLLAEFLVNNAIAALWQALEAIGVNEKHLAQMRQWVKSRSVSLRLRAEEKCKFLRKTERNVESDTKYVSKSTVFGKSEHYTVTKVTEWFWQFDGRYELVAFMGNETDKPILIASRNATVELKTTTETTPKAASVVRPNVDLNVTWFLQNLDSDRLGQFSINRADKACRTPRRNPQIAAVLSFAQAFAAWCSTVEQYFQGDWFSTEQAHGLDLSAIKEGGIFVPVVAIFEKNPAADKSDKKTALGELAHRVVPIGISIPLLQEQKRSIDERFAELCKVFPANDKLVHQTDAKLVVMMQHIRSILANMSEGIDYIEDLLYKQLIAALGKEVGPVDFANYQKFHNRKLFRKEYQPRPFSYAIRRPDHYPEGLLSIENQLADGSLADPINTSVCHAVAARPMKFALDASTNVSFFGDRYLHGFVQHKFAGDSGSALELVARARQFSSFILLLGTIVSADTFDPKYAVIIKDKDELKIPLMMETIPTPKEFRDAIESLSPEQQRFAKAYRAMQLESTLFAVAVVQIKPQMEKLLNLDNDALTKEIQLTQDLQQLFIEYQIPSDLISYDGDKNATPSAKVAVVKEYVKRMQEMVGLRAKAQLQEAKQAQDFRKAQPALDYLAYAEESVAYSAPPAPPPAMYFSGPPSAPSYGAPMPPPPGAAPPVGGRGGAYGGMPITVPTPAPMPSPITRATPAAAAPAKALAMAPVAAPVAKPEPVKAEAPKEKVVESAKDAALIPVSDAAVVDYTRIPREMERKFDELDEDSSLRPTIISAGNTWSKKYQKALLAAPESKTLRKDDQEGERKKAFDLLDALTKSGALTVECAELHVVIAATHTFDKSVINTVVQDNINPIEKVERSSLIVATAIQQRPAAALVAEEQIERIAQFNPKLIAQQQ